MTEQELRDELAKAIEYVLPVDLGEKRAKQYARMAANNAMAEVVRREVEQARADERERIAQAILDAHADPASPDELELAPGLRYAAHIARLKQETAP